MDLICNAPTIDPESLRHRAHWTSIKDDPPTKCKDVLLMFETGCMGVGRLDTTGLWLIYAGDGFYRGITDETPTHWMPRPELPKKPETGRG